MITELKTRYDKFSNEEIEFLQKILNVHGHLKSAMQLTGLNRNTLKRAKEGLQITKENASVIREKLLK